MEYLIQQFLAQNNLNGVSGVNYSLRNDGNGVYIDKWIYEIPKPIFTPNQFDETYLQEAKTSKLAQITYARNTFMYSKIEYNGSIFVNSEISGNNITSAIAIMGTTIDWLDTFGGLVVMTKAQLKELGGLIMNKRNIGYFKEAAFIGQINACTTIKQVEAINIDF